jgi:hypothetical protein
MIRTPKVMRAFATAIKRAKPEYTINTGLAQYFVSAPFLFLTTNNLSA